MISFDARMAERLYLDDWIVGLLKWDCALVVSLFGKCFHDEQFGDTYVQMVDCCNEYFEE